MLETPRGMAFSLFYFASADEGGAEKYRLVLDGARYADQHGFTAVWTPERHFHAFGGLFPNPSVLGAAIAAVTQRVAIRAGSVVLPLHHPMRVAEEWAVVDNLSNGRVGLAFASGWHARDFLLAPANYAERKRVMAESIETVRRLWRGETVTFANGAGLEETVRLLPRPVQPELPVWVTAAESLETFRLAGRIGAGVLTHMLNMDASTLAEKIAAYREAWRAHGHGPGDGHVALMLHTYLGPDLESVRATVRAPFLRYLEDAVDLATSDAASHGHSAVPSGVDAGLKARVLERSFERYFGSDALLGTPESCSVRVEKWKQLGVDELACLIDFGLPTDTVLAGLPHLTELMRRANAGLAPAEAAQVEVGLARAESRREAQDRLRRRREALDG